MSSDDTRPRAPLVTRRHALIGGAMACASGLAYARMPRDGRPVIAAKTFEGWVPKQVGGWREVTASGVILPPPDTTRDRLYDNLVTRTFAGPELPTIMFLLAYNNAQAGVVQVHRPEVCYPAGGFKLTPTQAIDLPVGEKTVPANVFTAASPRRVEEVLYFTRLGSAFPRSWVDQRLAVVDANLRGQIPDGMMLRVSVIGPPRPVAVAAMTDFIDQFFQVASPQLRRLLVA